jgi:hypothetical protein
MKLVELSISISYPYRRYLGVHNGGIHCVRLPLVKKLEEFCQKAEGGGEGEEFIPYKIGKLITNFFIQTKKISTDVNAV